jgi:hypothetical protein
MAEGFLRALGGDSFDVVSAGSEDTPLDPDAVAVMREVGGRYFRPQDESGKPLSRASFQLRRDPVRPRKGAHLSHFPGRDMAVAVGSRRPFARHLQGKSATPPFAAYATKFSSA